MTIHLRRPIARACVTTAAASLLCACAMFPREPGPQPEPETIRVQDTAQQERIVRLEAERARLKADLRHAEDALADLESGLLSLHSRADAVSAVADARIAVERASRRVTWRVDETRSARAKVDEAERQLAAGRAGSAVFFARRARHVAATLESEADRVEQSATTRLVNAQRVNLRAGPSKDHTVSMQLAKSTPVFAESARGDWVLVRTLAGDVGWVHQTLLSPR